MDLRRLTAPWRTSAFILTVVASVGCGSDDTNAPPPTSSPACEDALWNTTS